MARMRVYGSFTNLLRRFGRNDSGNVMLMTTIVSIPLIAAAGIAIDYGRAARAHQALQVVADSATLAAASAHNLTGASDIQAAARTKIAKSYIASEMQSIGDIWVTKAPTVNATANSITVSIPAKVKGSLTNVLSLLPQSGLIGGGSGGSASGTGDYMDIDVTAASTANWTTGPQFVCMVALNQSKSQTLSIQGTADIKAKGCAVMDNSSASVALYENGNATLTSSNTYVVGGTWGTAFYPPPTQVTKPFADPIAAQYATDYAATYSSATPRSTSTWNSSGASTVYPGLYTCTNKKTPVTNGVTINMQPGVYYIKDCTLQVKSGGTINGLGGVTIVMVGSNSNLDIQAGGNLNLKAPSSGSFAGIALAQDKDVTFTGGTKNSVIGGGSLDITGVIYIPTHDFYVTGNGTDVTNLSVGNPQFAIVADTITIQGNGQVNVGGNADYNSAGLPQLPISGTTPAVVSLK